MAEASVTVRPTGEHLVENLEDALAQADAAPEEPIARSNVPPELLKRSTVPELIGYALQDWAVIVACWALMTVTPGWLYPLWVLLIAGRMHAFGVILHDASHLPLRGKPLPVHVLEFLAGYPLATTLNAMRYHHLRHHRDSGMASDPYFKRGVRGNPVMYFLMWIRSVVLLPFWTVRGFFGSLAYHVPALRQVYARVFLQDRAGQPVGHTDEVRDCARAEHGQALFHLGLVALAAAWPEVVLYYFVVPAFVTGLLAGYRLLIEHDYTPTTNRHPSTVVATTNDHNLQWWAQIVIAPRNIGNHIVHHLHPQVGLKHLPAVRRWYMERYPTQYPRRPVS